MINKPKHKLLFIIVGVSLMACANLSTPNHLKPITNVKGIGTQKSDDHKIVDGGLWGVGQIKHDEEKFYYEISESDSGRLHKVFDVEFSICSVILGSLPSGAYQGRANAKEYYRSQRNGKGQKKVIVFGKTESGHYKIGYVSELPKKNQEVCIPISIAQEYQIKFNESTDQDKQSVCRKITNNR